MQPAGTRSCGWGVQLSSSELGATLRSASGHARRNGSRRAPRKLSPGDPAPLQAAALPLSALGEANAVSQPALCATPALGAPLRAAAAARAEGARAQGGLSHTSAPGSHTRRTGFTHPPAAPRLPNQAYHARVAKTCEHGKRQPREGKQQELRTVGVAVAARCGPAAPHTPEQADHASPARASVTYASRADDTWCRGTPHLWRLLLPGRDTVLLHERKQRLLLVRHDDVRKARTAGASSRWRVLRALTCGDGKPCNKRVSLAPRSGCARRKRCTPCSCSAQPASVVRRTRESGPRAARRAAGQTCFTGACCGAAAVPRPMRRGGHV